MLHAGGGYDEEVDVLVVGAGGCGLAAALSAADQGVTVGIVEKLDRAGGNTALSTGSVPAAGSRFQLDAGIRDSPEQMYSDLLRQSGPHDMVEVVRLLCDQSAALVAWLADEAGVTLELITDYRHVGHSVPRLHAPPSRRGADLVADLLAAVRAREIPLALSNPVVDLLVDEHGAVHGAVVAGGRVARTLIGAKKVILAANGFGANRDMVGEFCPDIAGAEYFGAPGSTGEAIRWSMDLDAGVANMAAYQAYAALSYPHGSLLSWTVIEKGGLIVDSRGQRFGDESIGYSGFATEVLDTGDFGYAVFDVRIRDYVSAHEIEFAELCDIGGVRVADSLTSLAESTGLPAESLQATVAGFDAAAGQRSPDVFGRTDFGFAPLTPPYCVCKITPGLFHTQGGLRVDRQARPVRNSGDAVPNLHAGGGVVAGLSGAGGARGYSSGNGLLSALGLGRIAGLAAAAGIRGTGSPAPVRTGP